MWSPLWATRSRSGHCPFSSSNEQSARQVHPSNAMKPSGMRRALALANVFNLLVAIYFIVISIISLVHLRWYHQLTISTKVRHIITSTTSYFAFLIILAVAIVLIAIFVIGTSRLSTKIYISSFKNLDQATTELAKDEATPVAVPLPAGSSSTGAGAGAGPTQPAEESQPQRQVRPEPAGKEASRKRLLALRGRAAGSGINNTLADSMGSYGAGLGASERALGGRGDPNTFCSMLLNFIAAIGLIVIIVVWLLNTGELVRDSVSTQLDFAFARYQFLNRSNHYTVAIEAMQNINNCCGSLDYTDFPHLRTSGLSNGHYPGSCCGKNIFGVLARVLCAPEEIVRAKQTTGCVIAIANHYDLVSLLVVPVSLASLFVCIMVMAMMTLLRSYEANCSSSSNSSSSRNSLQQHQSSSQTILSPRFVSAPDKLELNTTSKASNHKNTEPDDQRSPATMETVNNNNNSNNNNNN